MGKQPVVDFRQARKTKQIKDLKFGKSDIAISKYLTKGDAELSNLDIMELIKLYRTACFLKEEEFSKSVRREIENNIKLVKKHIDKLSNLLTVYFATVNFEECNELSNYSLTMIGSLVLDIDSWLVSYGNIVDDDFEYSFVDLEIVFLKKIGSFLTRQDKEKISFEKLINLIEHEDAIIAASLIGYTEIDLKEFDLDFEVINGIANYCSSDCQIVKKLIHEFEEFKHTEEEIVCCLNFEYICPALLKICFKKLSEFL